MSVLHGTLFEKHIQTEQAHALFLARSADAYYLHILQVLTATVSKLHYEPARTTVFIRTTEALRRTIQTVRMSEAEYASYNIASPFVRAKNHMAKLTDGGSVGYVLAVLSDLDGNEYLFKLTKMPVSGVKEEEEEEEEEQQKKIYKKNK